MAGSVAIDLACDYAPINHVETVTVPSLRTSNPAIIGQSLGGVGQNVATAISYCGVEVRLCSAVGKDAAGMTAMTELRKRGLQTSGISVLSDGCRTAQYVSFNDKDKNLVMAMADMTILESHVRDFDVVWKPQIDQCKPRWLVLDGNWNPETLAKWVEAGKSVGAKIAYEPVSAEKSSRVLRRRTGPSSTFSHNSALSPDRLDLATPNEIEVLAMAEQVEYLDEGIQASALFARSEILRHVQGQADGSSRYLDPEVPYAALRLLTRIDCVLVKLGSKGVLQAEILRDGDSRLSDKRYTLLCDDNDRQSYPITDPYPNLRGDTVGIYLRWFPPAEIVPVKDIVSVNGIGDTFLGVIIAGLARQNPRPIHDLVGLAQKGAICTLKSVQAVAPELKAFASRDFLS